MHSEQGLGDTIQFCRYAVQVTALGTTVILEVQPPLKALLKNLAGVSLVLDKGETLPYFDYHCLQKELRPGDKAILEQTRNIPFFGDALTDFTDTAALVELMDLVITVDTSVVHLAGAMGKEVWVLLPFNPDWRWLLDRSDSPWYPSARLFRQPGMGDWDSVIIDVKTALGNKHKIT